MLFSNGATCLHVYYSCLCELWEESLNSGGQQFHRARNHLTSQTIEHKKAKIYGDGNPGPGLGHSQNVAGKTG
jgi:hypothetical protein